MIKNKKLFFIFTVLALLLLLGVNSNAAVRKEYFTTTKYKIFETDGKILTGLDSNNMQTQTILNNLTLTDKTLEKRAYKPDGTQVKGTTLLGTGSYIQAVYQTDSSWYSYYDSIYIVLYGDTNGDGKITATDALAIIKNRTKKVAFANSYCEEAGRITGGTRKNNGVPSATDALAIVKYRLGKTTIDQSYNKQVTISSYEELYTQLQQNNTNFKFATTKEAKQVQSDYDKLKNVVSTYCKDNMSDVTKALVLHDYLVVGTKYERGDENNFNAAKSNIQNLNKAMNTTGFAYTYSSLLGIAGVPNKVRMDKYGTLANEVKIDGETYYVFCGYESSESENQGKGEALRFYFLRNDENSPLEIDTPNASTSNKYRGVTWPKYRKALDYKDSEIKTAEGKTIVKDMNGVIKAIASGKEYVIDVIDRSSYEVKEINERCKKIIAKYIKPGMTTEEKLVTIHDYICSNFMRNDSEAVRERKIDNTEYDCAWGSYKDTIISNVGSCWSATNYFNTLCAYIGIETKSVTEGQIPNPYGLGSHMWSLVKVDGKWYHVDCEGSDYYNYGEVDRHWLLKSDEAMHITENTYQPCTSKKYDLYKWPEFKGVAYYQDLTGIIDEDVPATSIWVKKYTDIVTGDKCNLRVKVFPYGSNSKVTYSSSNPSIASVDSLGNVTAKSKGQVTITVKTSNGVSKSLTINVNSKPDSIRVNDLTMKVGETKQATYTVKPNDATYKITDWHSYNPDVATVDQNGNVKALKPGVTYIYFWYSYPGVSSMTSMGTITVQAK